MRPYGLTALRLCTAAVFIAHGLQKLLGLWGGPGLNGTARLLTSLGLPFAYPLAILLTVTELGGGILLMLGWLTPWVSLALAIDMGVAIWKVHYANGFFMNWSGTGGRGHGIEYALVLFGGLLCLMLSGSGGLSVDEWRSQTQEARARGRARMRKV
ncbi:MAG TPA: DoxX family protein [Vicinamibacterales bacterium]|nr:DoxX family protein [Vicinamibacterales bacterium]